MLKPIAEAQLLKWEKSLDEINQHCFVPNLVLNKILSTSTIERVLANTGTNADYTLHTNHYKHTTSAIVLRTVSDAFVWANVLNQVHWQGQTVIELGPGKSRVIDMALAMNGFDGVVEKIDYTSWHNDPHDELQHNFQARTDALDIVTATSDISSSDLVSMNHFWDDLYVGIWAKQNNVNYFGHAMTRIDENNHCWEQSMAVSKQITQVVMTVVDNLTTRVNPGGMVVMKNYPSAFETHYHQIDRINFTFDLTNQVAKRFAQNGLKPVAVDLDAIEGPAGSKYPNSFFVLQKTT